MSASCPSPESWSLTRRVVVSVLLLWHVSAIVVAPWSGPPPASMLAQEVARGYNWYLTAAYLNHGYRFFAPDPGPSHLVRYELTYADGRVETGQLPDRKKNWPRLLYHRYFMVTESMYNIWRRIERVPPDIELTAEQQKLLQQANAGPQELLSQLGQGIARQLLSEHRAVSVKLLLVEHLIPLPDRVRLGERLDDVELYTVLEEIGTYSGTDS